MDASSRTQTVVKDLVHELPIQSQNALAVWAQRLLEIRASTEPAHQKVRLSLQATYRREVMSPLLSRAAISLKDLAWDDRSWSARLGIGASVAAATTFGAQGAGIAALGGAIGVPLWIVFGAGGSFAGMLLDELGRSPNSVRQLPQYAEPNDTVLDAEWEYDEEQLNSAEAMVLLSDAGGTPDRETLWHVFKRSYVEARAKQRKER